MKILDATAGYRGIWYQKNHPFVTWMDARKGKFTSYYNPKNQRTYDVNPDVVTTWDNMPFSDNEFDMIVFDPPHIVKKPSESKCRMEIQYTSLDKNNWQKTLQDGFKHLFRVLKPCGILVLKWCETDIKIMDVIKLSPYQPLFANMSLEHNGSERNSYMVIFLKYDVNNKLQLEG